MKKSLKTVEKPVKSGEVIKSSDGPNKMDEVPSRLIGKTTKPSEKTEKTVNLFDEAFKNILQ